MIYPLIEAKMALMAKFGSNAAKSNLFIEFAGNSKTKSFPSGDGAKKNCDLC
jgi:hypothetical protein